MQQPASTSPVTVDIWDSRTSWRVEITVNGRVRNEHLTDAQAAQAQRWARGRGSLPFSVTREEAGPLRQALRSHDTSGHIW